MGYPSIALQTNQIRLLSVRASQSPSSVQCALNVVELSKAPPFEALSYTWGNPRITKPIVVNDEEFYATVNLEAFLRQRQAEHEQQPIWVDAVCINQEDVQEKTLQVQKMAEIYEKSTWLTIWLGPGTGETDLAIRTLTKAARHEMLWTASDNENRAIEILMKRPWWTRVWIVQEVGFGAKGGIYGYDSWCNAVIGDQQTRLMCGGLSMGWGELVRATDNIEKARKSSESLRTSLARNVRGLEDGRLDVSEEHHPGYSSLLVNLIQHRSRQATDPRDKVFALLRQAPRIRGDVLKADYSASFDDVLRCVVRRETALVETLNILRHCQRRSPMALTSWAPDWSKAEEETIIPSLSAAIHVKPDVSYSDDLQTLYAKAVLWDTIDTILDLRLSGDIYDPFDTEFLIGVHRCRESVYQVPNPNPYGSNDDRVTALWQTLFGRLILLGLTGECPGYSGPVSCAKWLPPIPPGWRQRYEQDKKIGKDEGLRTWISLGVDLPNNPFGTSVLDPFQHLRKDCILADKETKSAGMQALHLTSLQQCRHIIGRKLFITKKGYIGLGPPDCVKGDTVSVFLGAEVPFVLRSQDEHFVLIGETYIRGIMFGQVMDMMKKGEVDVTLVTLK